MPRKINWLVSILLTALLIIGLMPYSIKVHAAATGGTLTFKVQTVTYAGKYAPRNVGAIWIEDSSGKFVKSLKVWAKKRITWLTNWGTASGSNTVDAITGATINTHEFHGVTWNCTDISGNVVNDGTYRICVEYTEANATGKCSRFEFLKGSKAVTLTPENQENFTDISINYQPEAAPPTPTNTPSNTKFLLKGYVAPDFTYSEETAAAHNSNFKVEITGTSYSAATDKNGCFEISGIPQGMYSIKISKPNYLSRTVNNVDISQDMLLGSKASPLYLWVGDVEINGVQDDSINMKDIVETAKSFNTTKNDSKYNINADFNLDNAVNMTDILIVAKHFNKTASDY